MTAELLIIIPTRGRPEKIPRIIDAWRDTGAFADGAEPLFAIDGDDPRAADYMDALGSIPFPYIHQCRFNGYHPRWQPMVTKLDRVAALHALGDGAPFAMGFAGDDHLPRTLGWAGAYLRELRAMRTGIVYCDDGYQGENLPTQWAMTTDIVQTLGRMVPAPVEHLYCDNSIMDLGRAIGRLQYLPDYLVQHQHPVAGFDGDEQHAQVNSREQYRTDRAAYRTWQRDGGLQHDAEQVAAMIRAKEQQ